MSSCHRWLKRTAIIAPFALIALVPAFFAYENWKGQKDIDRFRMEMKQAGFPTDLKSYFEQQIPENQDASQHPIIKNWGALEPSKKINAVRNEVESSPEFAGKTDAEKAEAVFQRTKSQHTFLLQLEEALNRPFVSYRVAWKTIPYGSKRIPTSVTTSLFKNDMEALAEDFIDLAIARKNSSYLKEAVDIFIQVIRHRQNVQNVFLVNGRPLPFIYSIFQTKFVELDDLKLFSEEDYRFLEGKLCSLNPKGVTFKSLEAELIRNSAYDTVDAFRIQTNFTKGWSWDRHEFYTRFKGLIRSLEPNGMTASRHVANWRYALHKMRNVHGGFTIEDYNLFFGRAENNRAKLSDGREIYVCFYPGSDRNGYELELFEDWQFNSDLSEAIQNGLSNEYNVWMVRGRIALQRFYLKNKYYPETLQALTPEYLPELGPLEPTTYKKLDDNSCEFVCSKMKRN